MTIKFNTTVQNTNLEFDKIYQVNGSAAMYPQNFFELTDKKFDIDFVFEKNDSGSITILPECMNYPIFWEDFFNGNDKAVAIFKTRFPAYADKIF